MEAINPQWITRMSKAILTYSALKTFMSCRWKYNLRMNDGLVSLAQDDYSFLGSVLHSVLEIWYALEIVILKLRELLSLSTGVFRSIYRTPGRNGTGICAMQCSRDTSIAIGDKWGLRNCAQRKLIDRRPTFLSITGVGSISGDAAAI